MRPDTGSPGQRLSISNYMEPWLGSVGHFTALAIIILEIVLVCASRVAGITVSSIISGYLPPLFQQILPPKNSCSLRDSIRGCSNPSLPWVSFTRIRPGRLPAQHRRKIIPIQPTTHPTHVYCFNGPTKKIPLPTQPHHSIQSTSLEEDKKKQQDKYCIVCLTHSSSPSPPLLAPCSSRYHYQSPRPPRRKPPHYRPGSGTVHVRSASSVPGRLVCG